MERSELGCSQILVAGAVIREDKGEVWTYYNALRSASSIEQYKRFNQVVKVPRGQASYTLHDGIHYDYKVSGGSPPNLLHWHSVLLVTSRQPSKFPG